VSNKKTIIAATLGGIFAVITIVNCCLILWMRRKDHQHRLSEQQPSTIKLGHPSKKRVVNSSSTVSFDWRRISPFQLSVLKPDDRHLKRDSNVSNVQSSERQRDSDTTLMQESEGDSETLRESAFTSRNVQLPIWESAKKLEDC